MKTGDGIEARFLSLVFLLILFALSVVLVRGAFGSEPPASEVWSLEEQEVLAREWQLAISRTSIPSEREAFYFLIIDECPDTEAAEAAHWALSNLYLDDFDEPKEAEAREILELFLERYPFSEWIAHVTDRLNWLKNSMDANKHVSKIRSIERGLFDFAGFFT